MSKLPGGFELLLQLDNISHGFGYDKRFELFFCSRVIGLTNPSDLVIAHRENRRLDSCEHPQRLPFSLHSRIFLRLLHRHS